MSTENISKEDKDKALSQDAVIGCLNAETNPIVVTSQSGNELIVIKPSYILITNEEKIKVLALMSAWISDELNSL